MRPSGQSRVSGNAPALDVDRPPVLRRWVSNRKDNITTLSVRLEIKLINFGRYERHVKAPNGGHFELS